MADVPDDRSASPPIPAAKGSYSIDWDNFDENINPFQPTVRLGSSPPVGGGLAGSKAGPGLDPFKPKQKLAKSPVHVAAPKEALAMNNNTKEPSLNGEDGSGDAVGSAGVVNGDSAPAQLPKYVQTQRMFCFKNEPVGSIS